MAVKGCTTCGAKEAPRFDKRYKQGLCEPCFSNRRAFCTKVADAEWFEANVPKLEMSLEELEATGAYSHLPTTSQQV